MEQLPDNIQQYILDHIDKEPDHLTELSRDTYASMLFPRMLSGHLQGRILKMLCEMIKPQHILEIGTYTGYSALCMAEALPDKGSIDTIEINDELETFIIKHLEGSGYKEKINLLIGDALDIIPDLNKTWDLVFIDGNKRSYIDYYQLVFDKLNTGAYIIADNVLWGGKVLEQVDVKDVQTQGIIAFNEMIAKDERVEKVIFPIRDGFTLIRKK